MMDRLKYILLCLAAVVTFTSCSDDEEPYRYGDFMYELVTYMGAENDRAVFTYQSYNDSPLITLTASNIKSVGANIGQRMFLNFEVDEKLSHTNQIVTVKGVSKVNTDTIVVAKSHSHDTLKMEPLKIESVWRTGDYLNVRCQIQYTEKARKMYLFTNGEIDADGTLNCYQIQDLMGAQTYYWIETYFSYYIKPAVESQDCKVLRYNVNDEFTKSFDFKVRN